jgi:hypothetical protein
MICASNGPAAVAAGKQCFQEDLPCCEQNLFLIAQITALLAKTS